MIKAHLIPQACVIKPPAIGPITGPRRGPKAYTAIAEARSFSEKRSLIDPPPQAMGAPPEIPATNEEVV